MEVSYKQEFQTENLIDETLKKKKLLIRPFKKCFHRITL